MVEKSLGRDLIDAQISLYQAIWRKQLETFSAILSRFKKEEQRKLLVETQ